MPLLLPLLLLLGPGCVPAMDDAPRTARNGPLIHAAGTLIQVGIFPKIGRLTLHPEGAFTLSDQQTGESRVLEVRDYSLRTKPDGYAFGPYRFHDAVRITPADDATIRIGEKKYRGSLVIRPNADGTLAVIDQLGIEEYLYGVLPAEMSTDWPLEALKAQAVVARTFALNNLGKFQAAGFDVSGDSRSQAYADVTRETPQVIHAVLETKGEVLTWKGHLIQAFFHSCCGGHTDDYGAVWGGTGAPRPLRGVADRYCRTSPQYEWTAYFSDDDVLRALQKHGHDVTRLRGLRVHEKDPAGFVHTLRVSATEDSFDVRAADFRAWMGATDLKSTKIVKIVRFRRGYEFHGRGFGHGVGLCQWGAEFMARQHDTYRQILAHYFPGAKLSRYDE